MAVTMFLLVAALVACVLQGVLHHIAQ